MSLLKVWDGTQWVPAGAGPAVANVTPTSPVTPMTGQLWFDTSDPGSAGSMPWVDDFVSATNAVLTVTATAGGTLLPTTSIYNVVVPSGRVLEVEYRAPLHDTPTGTGLVTQMLIAGVAVDGSYNSNSNANSYAAPVSLHGIYLGTGVSVAVRVDAWKVGAGTATAQGQSIAPIRIRHRIT